ncbi:hypothetical protein JM654_17870 [Microbacterium oxydans]|nr:hypothetical protein [Microbacterium oxydans]
MTSDSRAGQVGVITGASTWLAEGTPIGAEYGSSRDQPYLNLRPRADNATSPSTTTYSFAAPTPTSGWAFALGDIDSDSVRIHAVAPDGHVLTAAEIGLRDLFNYCAPGVVGKARVHRRGRRRADMGCRDPHPHRERGSCRHQRIRGVVRAVDSDPLPQLHLHPAIRSSRLPDVVRLGCE